MPRRLLHYEIVREIARGGMGIVYEARDTRLDRKVAIKVLPDSVSRTDRKHRFIQEARAASALNHPAIVTVYDLNSDDGVDLIAMEYVEGKTLAELIPHRGLKPSLAVKYAVQIADALARAHGAGILHRDLKPSNVMVTRDGRVKVLDFGLAKLLDRPGSSSDQPTMTVQALTAEGTVVGTTPYMSPEQAQGLNVDGRTDVFSFGCVLYEMLSGHKAFLGDTHVSTVAKILSEEPKPLQQIAAFVPVDLAKIVARCLRKDPDRRYQNMTDVKLALEDVDEESAPHVQERSVRSRWTSRLIAVALVGILAAGVYLAWQFLRAANAPVGTRPVQLTTLPGLETLPTLAPDGQHVAFTWSGARQDNDDIYVQRIGSGDPLRITTHPAVDFSPAWSPDGRWIAFLRGDMPGTLEVRLIAPLGAPERKVGEIHVRQQSIYPSFLAWFPDGRSLAVVDAPSPRDAESLFVMSVETGEMRRLTNPGSPRHDTPGMVADITPAVSPDGSSVVFSRGNELYFLAVRQDLSPVGEPRRLTERSMVAQQPAWSPDGTSIVFSAQGRLWQMPPSGERQPSELPFIGPDAFMPVVSRVLPGTASRLIFARTSSDTNIWRLDVPSTGSPAPSPPEPAIASTLIDNNPHISPDGSRVAFQSARSGSMQIWLSDLDGTNALQLTSMAAYTGTPRWSPDGQWIAFDSVDGGQWDVYVIPVSGGKPKAVAASAAFDAVPSFSRDGGSLYFTSNRSGDLEIWKVPVSGGTPMQLTHNRGVVAFESIDGKWLYYTQSQGPPSTLWRIPTIGGEPVRLLERVAARAFAVLETGIYYVVEQPRREHALSVIGSLGRLSRASTGRLEFFDFATSRSTTVADLGTIGLGLTASHDGRIVLFSRYEAPSGDLVMVENFK